MASSLNELAEAGLDATARRKGAPRIRREDVEDAPGVVKHPLRRAPRSFAAAGTASECGPLSARSRCGRVTEEGTMSLLGTLVSKILHPFSTEAQAAPAPTSGGAAPSTPPASGTAAPPSASGASPAGGSGQSVDVAAVLSEMEAKSGQKLDWRHSIVDLMKLVGLDSSLTHRKQLAEELNYTGDTNDSATMNVWLHKQVMKKLAENGGQVPADLKD
jgi:hypothetical protein